MPLSLVVMMIASALISCAGEVVKPQLHLKSLSDPTSYSAERLSLTTQTPPSQIVKEAELLYPGDFRVQYDEDDTQVVKINQYYNTEIEGNIYLWEYKINGEFPETGKASANTVADGDVIEYVFDVGTPVGNKFVYEPYDPALGLFPEEDVAETEGEADEGEADEGEEIAEE